MWLCMTPRSTNTIGCSGTWLSILTMSVPAQPLFPRTPPAAHHTSVPMHFSSPHFMHSSSSSSQALPALGGSVVSSSAPWPFIDASRPTNVLPRYVELESNMRERRRPVQLALALEQVKVKRDG